MPHPLLTTLRRSGAAWSPAGLLVSLVSYWKLDEASGDRADSHGSNTLADFNTVTQAAGKLGNAAQFTAATSEYLGVTDSASVSMGDIDFTVACWCYFDTLPNSGQGRGLISKWDIAGNDREYALLCENLAGTTRFKFAASANGTSATFAVADTLGTPSTATWYYVVGWHAAASDTLNIQVNNGAVDSVAYSAGVRDGTSSLHLGGLNTFVTHYHNGRIDGAAVWKRLLSTAERAALYNNGAGRDYPFG